MKKVLFTSLVGNYDELQDPEVIGEGWDYVCFSNHLKQENFSVWEIRPAPMIGVSNVENSRYPKLCPHHVLSDYEISIYLDANVIIKTDYIYNRSRELENNPNSLISIPLHPTRNCIYKEAECLKYRGKDKMDTIQRQIYFLQEERFPREYGLYENNVIWRRHLHSDIIKMNEDWWEIYLYYSKRDQLGLAYCLWKHKLHCIPFMSEHIKDHRKCEHFEFTKHRMKLFFHLNRWKSKLTYIVNNGRRPQD